MSNLTVSYVSQTPAASPAGGPAAAPADSPLGFLAALLDQLLPGGEAATTEAGAGANMPGLLNVDFSSSTAITPASPSDLIARITAQLDKLQADGSAPTSDLGAAIDALVAALSQTPAKSPDATAIHDRLTALAQSVAATAPALAQTLETQAAKLEPVAIDPAATAEPDPDALTIAHIIRTLLGHEASTSDKPATDATASQPGDELLQILASLGLSTAPAPAAASATASAEDTVGATTTVPTPLLRLSNQLTQIAQELTATAPDLAKKLDALATRLVSAEADPNLLGRLTSAAAQPDGTALDRLVQSLIDARPAPAPATPPATPQIAAPSALTIPAPIAPRQSKSAVTEVKAAPPEPAPVAADAAPEPTTRVTLAAKPGEPAADRSPEPKSEAKAAAVVADATKTDPSAQPAAPPQQPASAAIQHARTLPAAYQAVANPINMGQVAFEMVRQVHQGTSRFTIRLDPPELGRVDVKMHVDSTGALNARLTVDRAETLDLFQRDQRSLERALAQAGLDTNKTNLEFSLRQQHNPFAGMMGGDQRQQPGHGSAPRFAATGSDDLAPMPAITLYRGTASAGGVNIFV